jgi:hypothetical protein
MGRVWVVNPGQGCVFQGADRWAPPMEEHRGKRSVQVPTDGHQERMTLVITEVRRFNTLVMVLLSEVLAAYEMEGLGVPIEGHSSSGYTYAVT